MVCRFSTAKPCSRPISRRSWKSPSRPRPKRKSSPTNKCLALSPSTSNFRTNSRASIRANLGLNSSNMVCSMPQSARAASFSRNRVRRAGAASGARYSMAWGSKVITVAGRRSACPFATRRPNTALWPRCTPSKLPMVATEPRCRGARLCSPRMSLMEASTPSKYVPCPLLFSGGI